MMMEATDMRKLSHDARHERRVQVIRLRKYGQTYEQIAQQSGLSKTGVFDICKRHEQAGAKALRDAPHGRKHGDGRLLDATQEALIQKLIADKTPDQLKMAYALWTRARRAIYAACSAGQSGSENTLSMVRFAMPLDSSSMMPDQ